MSSKPKNAVPGAAPTISESGEIVDVSEDSKRAGLVRLLIIMIFPTFLFMFEQINIPPKRSRLAALNSQLADLQAYNGKAANSVVEIKKFKDDKQKLQSQLAIIETLSKSRIRDIKVLEAIQGMIPQKAWLVQLQMDQNKVVLAGRAVNDSDVSGFLDALSKSIFFTNVNLDSSVEERSEYGPVRKFEITCSLEKT
jgi:type IV pilus assembly protein PilN